MAHFLIVSIHFHLDFDLTLCNFQQPNYQSINYPKICWSDGTYIFKNFKIAIW